MMKNRDNLPDTLFMKKLQEFCIKQGVVGSQSGFVLSPDYTFPGNGLFNVPGLVRLLTPQRGIPNGWFMGGFPLLRQALMDGFFYVPGFFGKISSAKKIFKRG